ncbi:MAG: hypothetical protein HY329_11710 [Chloroflexi bacterium]|nr:hypothetical protein [Chloroflexota bacterium]
MPGGPKSRAGKDVVKFNSLAHGLRAVAPVVPGLEHEEDWEAHQAGVVTSYAPEGALESELAQRIALLLWRMRRVTRFETLSIAYAQQHAPDDYANRERGAATSLLRTLAITRPDVPVRPPTPESAFPVSLSVFRISRPTKVSRLSKPGMSSRRSSASAASASPT